MRGTNASSGVPFILSKSPIYLADIQDQITDTLEPSNNIQCNPTALQGGPTQPKL